MIESRLVHRVDNFDYRPNTQYFKDDDSIFFSYKGNLIKVDLVGNTIEKIDFGGIICSVLVI